MVSAAVRQILDGRVQSHLMQCSLNIQPCFSDVSTRAGALSSWRTGDARQMWIVWRKAGESSSVEQILNVAPFDGLDDLYNRLRNSLSPMGNLDFLL